MTFGVTKSIDFSLSPSAGYIKGVVTKITTGMGVNRATVKVIKDATEVMSTVTLSNGEFSIEVPPGIYAMKVSKDGYLEETKIDVKVFSDKITAVNFQLKEIEEIVKPSGS